MTDQDAGGAAPSYGRLSIQVLAAVTGASAIGLMGVLALVLTSPTVQAGPPYGDIAAAVIAMGGAVALASLASASAYFAQYALDAADARGGDGWRRAGAAFHKATIAAMGLSYVAFALGGVVFIHFCLAAMPTLAHLGAAPMVHAPPR